VATFGFVFGVAKIRGQRQKRTGLFGLWILSLCGHILMKMKKKGRFILRADVLMASSLTFESSGE
jgi:hypothetical protein